MPAIRHANTLALDTKTQAWLARALEQGLLDEDVQAFVQTELGIEQPKPSRARKGLWERNLAACLEFILDRGRTPNQKESALEEKRLGHWLAYQVVRSNRGDLAEGKKQSLAASHPLLASKIDGSNTRKGLWERNLAACLEFVLDRGRTPNQRASAPEEKRLGHWLANQEVMFNRGDLAEGKTQKLAASHPLLASKIDGSRAREGLWERNFAACLEFVLDTGRTPNAAASSTEEKRLGNWLTTQVSRSNRGDLAEGKTQRLAASHPLLASKTDGSWTREGLWERNLDACLEFVHATGRTPSRKASTDEEKRLGRWLTNQVAVFNRGDVSADREESLRGSHELIRRRVFKE